MMKRFFWAAVICCCLSLPARAEIQPGAFTLSPLLGRHMFDGAQSLETSSFWGFGLGYNLTQSWALEGLYTRANADSDHISTTDTKVETYRLDVLYHFQPAEKLVPYVAAGLGAIYSDPNSGAQRDHLLFNYGVGVKYFILDQLIALRADIRHLVDFPEPDHNLQYSAGLVFQFGRPAVAPEPIVIPEPAPSPAPAPPPPPLDTDGDGVTDDQDQCPGTVSGATVDQSGCPLDSDGDGVPDDLDACPATPSGIAVNARGCPPDSDGDGVPDYLDQCPGTIEGTVVNYKGCQLDADGDGVVDESDSCPDTPQGVSVDTNGCPTSLTLHINFGHDSSKIGPQYDSEIAKAAQCINTYPGNIVYIDGHTDNRGAAEYNRRLSEQRAEAVKSRLTEKFDIPAERMTARGFGEEHPVASNETPEGRAQNRRVEVACGAE